MTARPLRTQNLHKIMTTWRHDFHAHPELGFDETRTSKKVADLLTEFGLDVHTGIGKTGVVGILRKGSSMRSIGLRADMDALPINELNTFKHASSHENIMHACGHDGHTTMLLGAAKTLADSGNFDGQAVFIFQPAEEHGKGGPAMIADGLFEKFPVDEVYGMHNMPGTELGTFAMRTGTMMASEALFEIVITARGGHAAMPHHGVGRHRCWRRNRRRTANHRLTQTRPRAQRRRLGHRFRHGWPAQCFAGPRNTLRRCPRADAWCERADRSKDAPDR